MTICRGEVWWGDFGPAGGSAPAFHRPALVVSADSFNRSAIQTVIVAAITTSPRLARRPGNVILPTGVGGLDRESVVNVSQLATVDKEQLIERLGLLGIGFMRQVDAGLSLVLGV
ncbi:MAG TPA: type II toxin-antitoxin system PemK/MazF family toxin [Candidatus Dormibacteraeota bacterium]|nr:type II toxin-antitoxin system PemK/MazF family toxin [Candidatus Dormibacteraeota bacterium]